MTKNKVVINTNKRNNIDCCLFFEEAEINLSSSKKIIGVTANSKISNYEALNGELRVAGKIALKAIYLNEEDVMMSSDYNKEFLETIVINDISSNDKAILLSKVYDAEYSGTNDLRVKLTLGIQGYYIKEMPLELLDAQGDDIYCKKTKVQLENVNTLTDTSIEISKSFECKEPLIKILSYNTNAIINKVYAYDELYQVEGEAITSLIGLGENNKLINQNFSQNFTIEVPDSNVTSLSEFMIECVNKSTTIILEEQASKNIIIDLEIGLKGISIIKNEADIITDAYSVDKELNIQEDKILIDTELWQKNKMENITGTIKVNDEIENMIAVITPFYTTINTINNFGLYAEGMIVAEVVYLNKQGEVNTVKGEMPYQILIDKDISDKENMLAEIIITDNTVKMKSVNELEMNMNALISVKGGIRKPIQVVSDIEQGENKGFNDIAISLYIAKDGESMWDVAKTLSTNEQTLLKLNPDIKLPLKSGDKILLYREFSF